MAQLNNQQRSNLPPSKFAIPSKAPGKFKPPTMGMNPADKKKMMQQAMMKRAKG